LYRIYLPIIFPKRLNSSQRVRLLLTGVAKDANSTQDAVRLILTKSSWLSSMKYTEYVAKITETDFTGSSIKASFYPISRPQLYNS